MIMMTKTTNMEKELNEAEEEVVVVMMMMMR